LDDAADRSRALHRLATAGAVLAIVAATAAWDFLDHPHWYKVSWVPFATGLVRPLDMLANIALYVPLGFLLSFKRRRLLATLAIACALSMAMEFTQVWSHSRFPSATDVLLNLVGSYLGVRLAERRRMIEASRAPAPAPSDASSA
jgi:glycopeptide antibiotics resistance protein